MVVGSIVLMVFLFYAYKRYRTVLKLAEQQKQASQGTSKQFSSRYPSAYQPPYAHTPTSSVHQPPQQHAPLLLSPPREPSTSQVVLQPPLIS
ncbi:unnamed protein product [Rotaria sp. Silwood1]|nr:unnamed protein product [Rotaria sp. Silwood1]CAF4015935.1 unnamed protein product [Rotaria sp. Silwood1]CAF5007723.1 unnamed protein product [Rotaria sp. Silwood1]CAF5050784.1 unnamed protein product [Rotaria sp. Silwood1]